MIGSSLGFDGILELVYFQWTLLCAGANHAIPDGKFGTRRLRLATVPVARC